MLPQMPRVTNMRARHGITLSIWEGVPIFYWPTFGTNLEEPSFYLSSVKFKNDTIFGFQAYTDWNIYQSLGIQGPEGTSLKGSLDYLSERGPAAGVRFEYNRPTWLFGAPGTGFTDAWFISDQGQDVLGLDRLNLTPEKEVRGRVLGRNRIFSLLNVELMGESGYISDRNFLEAVLRKRRDTEKDFASGLRFCAAITVTACWIFPATPALTTFLPRPNRYLGLTITCSGKTCLVSGSPITFFRGRGTPEPRPTSAPVDPVDLAKFSLRPWESDSEGLVATTRQELSMPLCRAWDVVPYLSGEAGFWKSTSTKKIKLDWLDKPVCAFTSVLRAYPNIENRLFDLRGIAHKVTLESDLFYADANKDMDLFPLYDPLDDNSQEHFRRLFIFNTFGGALPAQFDERSYALRNGMNCWVTADAVSRTT